MLIGEYPWSWQYKVQFMPEYIQKLISKSLIFFLKRSLFCCILVLTWKATQAWSEISWGMEKISSCPMTYAWILMQYLHLNVPSLAASPQLANFSTSLAKKTGSIKACVDYTDSAVDPMTSRSTIMMNQPPIKAFEVWFPLHPCFIDYNLHFFTLSRCRQFALF